MVRQISKDKVKEGDVGEGTREKGSETKNDLGSNDDSRGRQGVSQESKLKYLNELFDDYVDSLTQSKPNGKQNKIRKYFTNLTVRDRSEKLVAVENIFGD